MSHDLIGLSRAALAAIDRKWGGETERKRSNVFGPRMVSTLTALADATGYGKMECLQGLPTLEDVQ